MLRGLFWLAALSGIVYVIVAWATAPEARPSKEARAKKQPPDEERPENPRPAPAGKADQPSQRQRRERAPSGPVVRQEEKGGRLTEPVIIKGARVNNIDRQEVSSQREGQLLFLGTEVSDPKKVEPHKLYTVYTHFIATEA